MGESLGQMFVKKDPERLGLLIVPATPARALLRAVDPPTSCSAIMAIN